MSSQPSSSYEWVIWIPCPNDGSCNSALWCASCRCILLNAVQASSLSIEIFFSKHLVQVYSRQQWLHSPDSFQQLLGLSFPPPSSPPVVRTPVAHSIRQRLYNTNLEGSYYSMGVSNAPTSISSMVSPHGHKIEQHFDPWSITI